MIVDNAQQTGNEGQQTGNEGQQGADDAAAKAAADKAASDKAAADAAAAQTPEAKAAAEAKTKADADAAAAKAKASTAPEKYADFKLPEGVALDKDLMTEFGALAKEANLPQDAAQKFADIGAKIAQKQVDALKGALEKQSADWAAAAQTDKEFGGDKFKENVGVAIEGRKQFATPEFIAFLDSTGLGNHPEMIRTFWKIGQHFKSDGVENGRAGGAPNKAAGEGWYDHPTSRASANNTTT